MYMYCSLSSRLASRTAEGMNGIDLAWCTVCRVKMLCSARGCAMAFVCYLVRSGTLSSHGSLQWGLIQYVQRPSKSRKTTTTAQGSNNDVMVCIVPTSSGNLMARSGR